jgi:hypothetical protein
MMITVEETERTPNGLDFLIKDDSDGRCLAWAYSKETAELIARLLNDFEMKEGR